jgi:chromosome segregation ATPase
MDIQEVPNDNSHELPKASYYKNQLNNLIEQMPSVLDDFQQYYVFTNTTPSSVEYQNMYQNILNNISTINSQVFTITNEIEKNTQTINSELQKFNEQIEEGKKENKLLKKKLGLTDNRIDDSEQLIEDYEEMYNLTYLKNFNKIIGIIIASYILKQMFYS